MKNFYIIVDDAFLETLSLDIQNELKQVIDKLPSSSESKKDYRSYVRMCPYCNKFGIFGIRVFEESDDRSMDPSICAFCGESTPYEKITDSIKKAQILYDLSNFYASNDTNKKNVQNERILLEQSVVVLATGIELFLKDIYVLSMNLKYVKPEYSLHLKFNQDVKNDFLNIGKTIRKFKTEFEIDLSKILGQDAIKNLTYLMLMRNLIVHNNGNVDLIFLNNIPPNQKEKFRIASPVPITKDEIVEFINTTKIVLEKIETEFDKIIVPELRKRIEKNLDSLKN